MKATEICDKYPMSYRIELTDNEMNYPIHTYECTLSISPTANCQTFSIGQACIIISIKDYCMDDFIKLLISTAGKYQLIIDLLEPHVKPVFDKLKPYISWSEKISYINRTDAPMTLFLIKLNEDKIMELFKNKP